MFRKVSISLLVALAALLVFAVAVSAQGRWDGAGPNGDGMRPQQMHAWQQQNSDGSDQPFGYRNNDGTCANFVDEDGDGLCDNAGTSAALGRMGPSGRMNGMNRGQGGMGMAAAGQRLHRFGDGICDYESAPRDGTGNQFGQ